jgi:hypothetical protein
VVANAARPLLAGFICLALITIILPMRAESLPSLKHHCCSAAVMQPAVVRGGTSQSCPRGPIQTQQCCAACALSLTFISFAASSFTFSTFCRGQLPNVFAGAFERCDQPPVPPPRSAALS